jgi:hypothetical protein
VRSAGLGLVLACGRSAGCSGRKEEPNLPGGAQPRVLEAGDYLTLLAVAERFVPGSAAHPGAAQLGVAARVDRELSFHSDRLRRDVRDALRLISVWPLPLRFARFADLPGAAQDAELAAHATSRLAFRRTAFQGLKLLVMFFHYTQDEAWAGTGYDGPWVPRVPPAASA